MTQGVVLFAHDTDQIKYTQLAAWSAQRIKRWLALPVCLVTSDPDITDPVFDVIIHQDRQQGESRSFADLDQPMTWFNHDRCSAYALSPFDQTVLLDVDYVVASEDLLQVLEIPTDIAAPRWAMDVTGSSDFVDLNHFGRHSMPIAWATVVMFRRSSTAELVFDMMGMIQSNWRHYRDLYGITQSKYRNDFALAMALNTVYGHWAQWPEIPWSLATVEPQHRLTQTDQDSFRVDFIKEGRPRWVDLAGMDFHAMGKSYLGDIVGCAR